MTTPLLYHNYYTLNNQASNLKMQSTVSKSEQIFDYRINEYSRYREIRFYYTPASIIRSFIENKLHTLVPDDQRHLFVIHHADLCCALVNPTKLDDNIKSTIRCYNLGKSKNNENLYFHKVLFKDGL